MKMLRTSAMTDKYTKCWLFMKFEGGLWISVHILMPIMSSAMSVEIAKKVIVEVVSLLKDKHC